MKNTLQPRSMVLFIGSLLPNNLDHATTCRLAWGVLPIRVEVENDG